MAGGWGWQVVMPFHQGFPSLWFSRGLWFALHTEPLENGEEGGLVLGGHSGLGRLAACVFGSMGPFALLGQGGSGLGLPWSLLDLTGPVAL